MASRTKYKRNYDLKCQECQSDFKALRPSDKFCCYACRTRNREKQPDRIAYRKQISKNWNEKNYEHRRDYMLKFTYGISLNQFEKLLAEQGGGCAICGKTSEEEGKSLAVDHDHKTGEIFGILCSLCNKFLIGHIREPIAFKRAWEYLQKGTGLFVPPKKPKRRKRRKRK